MTNASSRRRRAGFAALLMAGSTLGGLAFWQGDSAFAQSATPPAINAPAINQAGLPGFADLVARVRPAVVTITTVQRVADQGEQSPFPRGSQQDRNFRRQFGDNQPGRRAAQALGSGFVVDAAGYVVTNNHVVQDAAEVRVTLDDGRELPARVVGRDPRTDLALLKVEAGAPLAFLNLGDSDRARPGDWVVAVGNPFGLGGTVTAGVVSARGRNIGAGPYDDFLQIDAPINQGNSGGPLFALDGSVIGVNTAIFSPSGGSVGIGFAIPSNMVRTVVADLKEHGRVERGFLGAMTQQVTPQLAEAMRIPTAKGALVAEVTPDSPAARAGLRPGDVITALDGHQVNDQRDLARTVAGVRPGTAVTLGVVRDGQNQELRATLAALTDKAPGSEQASAEQGGREPVGVALAPIDDAMRQQLNLPRNTNGAVVAEVRPDSRAAAAGIRPGDVITRVGNQEVANPEQAARAIREGSTGPLALQVVREGRSLFVAVPTKQG
jgi:serine protease Do